ncbi:hypothetical protein BDW66DRAFT_63061 [Aspergillus desertorum]
MQAVEVLCLMCACDLYIYRQALDLRALKILFWRTRYPRYTMSQRAFSRRTCPAQRLRC